MAIKTISLWVTTNSGKTFIQNFLVKLSANASKSQGKCYRKRLVVSRIYNSHKYTILIKAYEMAPIRL